MKIHVVNRYDDFKQLREQWNKLLFKSLHPMVFLTHQWIDVWWKAFGEDKELFILLVQDGHDVVAIAPFMINKGQHIVVGETNTRVEVKKIEFLANAHTPRADLILRDDKPIEACEAITEFLLNDRRDSWDLLSLTYLLGSSPAAKYLKASLTEHGVHYKEYSQMSTPYVPITDCWNDYFNKLQPRFRRNLVSRMRKLVECGNINLMVYRDVDGLGDILKEVFNVAAMSWKAKEGTALSSTIQSRKFYTELAYAAAKEGWLELFILYLERKPMVFDFCLRYDNKLFDLKTEFDETYASYGVGNIIKYKQFQSIFSSDLAEFDFLGPSMMWKQRWSMESERKHTMLYVFNKNGKGYFLKFCYDAKDYVKRMLF
jgi:CelD/BcsL family acetyltransferase involved in cellulose biosynthesis